MGYSGFAKIAKKKKNPHTKYQLEASQIINKLTRWMQAMKPSQGPSQQFLMIPSKVMKVTPKTASPPRPVILTRPKSRHYIRFTKRNHLM